MKKAKEQLMWALIGGNGGLLGTFKTRNEAREARYYPDERVVRVAVRILPEKKS